MAWGLEYGLNGWHSTTHGGQACGLVSGKLRQAAKPSATYVHPCTVVVPQPLKLPRWKERRLQHKQQPEASGTRLVFRPETTLLSRHSTASPSTPYLAVSCHSRLSLYQLFYLYLYLYLYIPIYLCISLSTFCSTFLLSDNPHSDCPPLQIRYLPLLYHLTLWITDHWHFSTHLK